jgi:hypothetical protein
MQDVGPCRTAGPAGGLQGACRGLQGPALLGPVSRLDAGVGLGRNLLPLAHGAPERVGAALNLPLAVVQAVTRLAPPLLLRLDEGTQRRAPCLGAPY